MKSLKTTLSLILLLSVTVLTAQINTINVSTPFYKTGFEVTTVIQDNQIHQLRLTADGVGDCLNNSTLRFIFSDFTFLVLTESESTNENCDKVYFDISLEQAFILHSTTIRKIMYINGTENKSISGFPQNQYYFTDYIPYLITEFNSI